MEIDDVPVTRPSREMGVLTRHVISRSVLTMEIDDVPVTF